MGTPGTRMIAGSTGANQSSAAGVGRLVIRIRHERRSVRRATQWAIAQIDDRR
jgi:hypothetical protein